MSPLPTTMTAIELFSILFLIITTATPSLSSVAPPPPPTAKSIYEALKLHALPAGLFPKGITQFSMDPFSGKFEAHLTRTCESKFETRVRYDLNVSGIIQYGQILSLSGVAAQDLFLWFPIKTIRVDVPSSGLIYFDVGVVRKQFSLSFFETPRDCSDGDNNVVFFNDRGRVIKSQSAKFIEERYQADERRAVS